VPFGASASCSQGDGFQPGAATARGVVNHFWSGCEQIFYAHRCVTFALIDLRWGSLGYSGLLLTGRGTKKVENCSLKGDTEQGQSLRENSLPNQLLVVHIGALMFF